MTSPPTFCFLASISVITPLGVETIAMPNPLFILGKLSALENILLPGFETLSIELITGLPELYLRFILIVRMQILELLIETVILLILEFLTLLLILVNKLYNLPTV